MKEIIINSLEKSLSYQDYRTLILDLLKENKSTGSSQSEDLFNYSVLNDKRMKRLDKTIQLSNKTKSILQNPLKKQTWLVLAEGWCGDAAQNLPVINKITEQSADVDLRIVLRDENLDLMDKFLTNKGRAIPKLIAIDEDYNVLFTWGPRPSIATKMIVDYKEKHGVVDAKIKQELQLWYNKNKGENLQEDLLALLKGVN